MNRIGRTPRYWCGCRKSLLTKDQEPEFWQPWLEKARFGGMRVVSPLRAALAKQLARLVTSSVVWGLVARHRASKVAPDTAHPKREPALRDNWENTHGDASSPAESKGGIWPKGPLYVLERGSFWSDGAHSALLGSESSSPKHAQRLRAPVCLCLGCDRPGRGRAGP